jgi:hypothetical protein
MEGKEFKNKIRQIESKNKELEQEFTSIGFSFITLNDIKREIVSPQFQIQHLILFLKQKMDKLREIKGGLELDKMFGFGTRAGLEKINDLEQKINEHNNLLNIISRYLKTGDIKNDSTIEEFEDFLKKREIYLIHILYPDIIDKIEK